MSSRAFTSSMVSLQPHEGSSETPRSKPIMIYPVRFNPTRVRLKRSPSTSTSGMSLRFNPTRVRLKRDCNPGGRGGTRGFNPTRVRLKLCDDTWTDPRYRFNPTRVRLKRARRRSSTTSSQRFNPTRVRLKRLYNRPVATLSGASTPRGFV